MRKGCSSWNKNFFYWERLYLCTLRASIPVQPALPGNGAARLAHSVLSAKVYRHLYLISFSLFCIKPHCLQQTRFYSQLLKRRKRNYCRWCRISYFLCNRASENQQDKSETEAKVSIRFGSHSLMPKGGEDFFSQSLLSRLSAGSLGSQGSRGEPPLDFTSQLPGEQPHCLQTAPGRKVLSGQAIESFSWVRLSRCHPLQLRQAPRCLR